MKINYTKANIYGIKQAYSSMSQTDFLNDLNSIVNLDDIYIKIVANNKTVYNSNSAISNIYKNEINQINQSLVDSPEDTVSTTIRDKVTAKDTWVYASYLDPSQKTVIYVVSPLYPMDSTINILQDQFIYITFISLALASIVAIFYAQKLTKPILTLTERAKSLGNGEYGRVYDTKTAYTELNSLAQTLNDASVKLEKSAVFQKNLLSNLSHELKTPLTMIQSYAEMIRDLSGDDKEAREKHLNIIIEESHTVNTLINDIMTLAKSQAGELKLNYSIFNIKDLFKSILKTYELKLEQGEYKVSFICHSDIYVKADEDKIRQVVTNFLTNAMKYCGQDKLIVIEVKKIGDMVSCAIIDNGKGIAPNEAEFIWNRFAQSSTNHIRKTSGSGVGLSIVKEILVAHQANFGLETKVGAGSKFWFELKCYKPPEASPKALDFTRFMVTR
ncbi:MAG: HAMP domain-containing sensor histidine kinase [Eubacteriales bacterium]|nr:HAMP domain-containing sensor histidine kinase [Eubacteriales bacterium]MDY3333227.1 HAMP domain-containing sensor histidine kinase [Gallibacter sp.]